MSPGEGNLERLERSEALDAGAREVRWAPRVPLHKIRRLYETDALGLVDEEQIDDVGYALLARCQSVLEATEAHHHGRLRCPRCRAAIQRRGRPDRPQDDAEEVRCGTCGWATTARAYRVTYRGKQLLGENALPAFETFLRDFQRATSPQEKMLAIDRLIHAVHGGLALGWVGRPAAVNLLGGTIREIFSLLDELAYGQGSSQALLEGRAAWQTTRQVAAHLSRTWRLDEDAPPEGDPLAERLAAQVEEIEATQGRFRLLVSCVAEADAPTMSDLRALANRVRDALGEPHVLVLAGGLTGDEDGGALHFLAIVSPELAERGLRADDLVARLARAVGGGGGGAAREAFGGGGDRSRLQGALDEVRRAARPAPG